MGSDRSQWSTFIRRVGRLGGGAVRLAARAAATPLVEPLEGRQLLSSTLVSVANDGTPGNGASGESSVSSDGRFVVFSSDSSNLVSGDSNSARDVFLRDTQQNKTFLVSATTAGASGNGRSFEPIISGDGMWIAFRSEATNLVSGDTNSVSDIFLADVHDPAHPAVTRVSVGPGGVQANGFSGEPTISADGRFVAFSSFASNLAAGDTNQHNDVFRFDRTTGQVVLVSAVNGTTTPGNGTSFDPSISADGHFVSFHSDSSNFVGNDTNSNTDVFLRDINSNTTTLISVNQAGTGPGNQASTASSLSTTGQFVVFRSAASDLTPLDTNNNDDVFLRDTQTGTTTLLSINQGRTASGHGLSKEPSVDQNGRFASFSSTANDLVSGDANNSSDVFVRDLQAGPITLLSMNAAGTGAANGLSSDPYVAANGQFVSYSSTATDLVSGVTVNGVQQVYVASTPIGPNPGPGGGGGGGGHDPADRDRPDRPDRPGHRRHDDQLQRQPRRRRRAEHGDRRQRDGDPAEHRARRRHADHRDARQHRRQRPRRRRDLQLRGPRRVGLPAINGQYTVNLPTDAVKDAAGNSAVAGPIGTFTLNVCPPECPDLIGQMTSKFPAAILAGKRGHAVVRMTNQGMMPVAGPVTVNLFVSDDANFSFNDVQVATSTRNLKLKTGKSKNRAFNFVYPATLGGGNYFLVARIDASNNVAETKERQQLPGDGGADQHRPGVRGPAGPGRGPHRRPDAGRRRDVGRHRHQRRQRPAPQGRADYPLGHDRPGRLGRGGPDHRHQGLHDRPRKEQVGEGEVHRPQHPDARGLLPAVEPRPAEHDPRVG